MFVAIISVPMELGLPGSGCGRQGRWGFGRRPRPAHLRWVFQRGVQRRAEVGRKVSDTVATVGATSRQIMSVRDRLPAQHVTCVVMEAAGDYWKPFHYLREDLAGVQIMLADARHVRNMPGRDTDVADPGSLDCRQECPSGDGRPRQETVANGRTSSADPLDGDESRIHCRDL